jgi:hypothetical protein
MKSLCLLLLSLLCACGTKESKNHNEVNVAEAEEVIGLHSSTECGRVIELQGQNNIFNWTNAEIGNLQKIIIRTNNKTVTYLEAKDAGFLESDASYKISERRLFFKTQSKSLVFTFPESGTGSIENAPGEYLIGYLTYDDGSGYLAKFLCTR